MKIVVAKTAGFCFGVSRAIKMVQNSLDKKTDKKIFSLGPIIHNKQVVEEFENKGVSVVDSIEQVEDESTLIVRAHGVSPKVYEQMREKKVETVDTTCPFVKKIHKIVSECCSVDCKTIIVGDREHPEVIGIKGWSEDAIVIGDEEEAKSIEVSGKVCVVAQTTLSKEKWDNICAILKQESDQIEIHNTICNATSERQKEAQEIARQVDIMFIVGDPNSSNTRKLYEISKKYCGNTFLIENANQLDKVLSTGGGSLLSTDFKVGITAGASTPDRIIKEVTGKMSEINKPIEEEMSFEELFEKTMRTLENGEILKGKVIGVTNKEVSVDLGYKADGIIPLEEFSDNPEEKPSELFKPGDEIEVYVMKVNDGEGNVLLSRKRIEYTKGWDRLAEAYENGTFVKGTVSDVVNGGVIALVSGLKVFIPASQLSDRYVDDLNEFRKKSLELKILDFNRQKKKVVGSHKAVLMHEREIAKKDLWQKIEVGQVLKGAAKRITDFGVFIDIGGVDGLIHISELSWNRIKHPSELVKVGQELEVRVLELDREKEKISLGYRKAADDPWQSAINKHEVGKVVNGKVVNMMPFGAFVEIEPGLTGLVHVSQISNRRVAKPQDVLSIGQEVEAKITEIDMEKKKISMSIKETLPIVEVSKVEKTEKPEHYEVIPDEHKEEMNLTLGDLVNKAELNKVDEVQKGEEEKAEDGKAELPVEEKKAEEEPEKETGAKPADGGENETDSEQTKDDAGEDEK